MYKIMKNGAMIGLGDKPAYIRIQPNGCYGLCSRDEAQGIVLDGTPYHFDVETVVIEDSTASRIAKDYQAAASVFVEQTDLGNISEATASMHPDLFPKLNENGNLIRRGSHINWNGVIKRAANDLWDTEDNNPDNAPTLWESIEYIEGYRIIPDVITAGTAFTKDECGWWKDELYRSIYEGSNVWTPDALPAGWELVN